LGLKSLAKIGPKLGGISVLAISQNKKRMEVSLAKDLHLGGGPSIAFMKAENDFQSIVKVCPLNESA
jgi:hypothetical protein